MGDKSYVVLPPDEIYDQAIIEYRNKRFDNAIERLSEIERLYPFTKFAEKSRVLSAYFQFLIRDYPSVALTCGRYISDYPQGDYLEYIYYLRGVSHYRQVVDTNRSGEFMLEAYKAFDEFILLYPNGKYVNKVKELKVHLHSRLALKEMKIGVFYLENANYVAAIQRFKGVIANYSNTSYKPEALFRIYEAYAALGIVEQSNRYKQQLLKEFSDSVWVQGLRR